MVFKAMNELVRKYLLNLITKKSNSVRSLRLNDQNFSAVGMRLWNRHPVNRCFGDLKMLFKTVCGHAVSKGIYINETIDIVRMTTLCLLSSQNVFS